MADNQTPEQAARAERTIRQSRMVRREGSWQVRHTTVQTCPVLSSSRPTCSEIVYSEQVVAGLLSGG